MDETRGPLAWLGEPLAITFGGLLVAVLGTVSLYLFPSTRFTGLTPAVALQGVAIFGGIAVMLLGAHLISAETPRERGERLRSAARGALAFGLALGTLSALNIPFAVGIAIATTTPLAERLRRVFAWLGG